jgi:hypothetical protein
VRAPHVERDDAKVAQAREAANGHAWNFGSRDTRVGSWSRPDMCCR